MITIQNIVDGICKALSDAFGDGYEIYTENVQQNLTEPCFLVKLVKPTQNQFFGKRYYRTQLFCIHYFPKSKDEPDAECFEVQDKLNDCLEYITVDGDLIRGTQMNSDITDDVLSFMVNYDMYVIKQPETVPEMETLDHSTDVKG